MGAVVGAAYAGGMTALEIREHSIRLLSNKIDMARHVFGVKQARLRDIISLRSLTSLHLDGKKLADIALPDHLPQLIEEQKIPLKVVTVDFERIEEIVLTSGSILEDVGASIAIPGLISAPRINGRIHVDGGVKNPVPFNHVTEGMDLVVAIDVTGKPKTISRAHPSNLEIAVGSLLIMFNELAEFRRAQTPPDIYISPEINGFGPGDFFKVKEIFAAAEKSKDQLKRELELRVKALA